MCNKVLIKKGTFNNSFISNASISQKNVLFQTLGQYQDIVIIIMTCKFLDVNVIVILKKTTSMQKDL